MSKKIRICLAGVIGILLAFLIFRFYQVPVNNNMTLYLEISAENKDTYQLYYLTEKGQEYSELQTGTSVYSGENAVREISFSLPLDTKTIRLDFGTQPDVITITKAYVSYSHKKEAIDCAILGQMDTKQQISSVKKTENGYQITTDGNDPYGVMDMADTIDALQPFFQETQEQLAYFYKIVLSVIVVVLLLAAAVVFGKIQSLIQEVWHSKRLLLRLARNDFKTRYAGSYLGIIWAFIQPIVTVLVYWFVFQVGFRSGGVSEYPYVLWLISGLIPWFFFSEAWNSATNSLIEYTYLVKKVVFKISILPIVKIVSALFVHVFFVFFLLFMFCLYGYWPDIYAIQVLYYSFCMIMLVLGLSYFTCSIVVFFRDLGQIIAIILQVGVWMTPIMWNVSMLGSDLRWIMKLNPMYYVVYGYRGALMDKVWFFEDLPLTIYFWAFTALMFGIGTLVFKKLKVHFADVL